MFDYHSPNPFITKKEIMPVVQHTPDAGSIVEIPNNILFSNFSPFVGVRALALVPIDSNLLPQQLLIWRETNRLPSVILSLSFCHPERSEGSHALGHEILRWHSG
jgi:hypothetical protein